MSGNSDPYKEDKRLLETRWPRRPRVCIYPWIQSAPAPQLLKVDDVRTHVCAIFLRICAKFVLLNAKQEIQALKKNYFGTIPKISTFFLWHLRPIPLHNIFSSKIRLRKIIDFQKVCPPLGTTPMAPPAPGTDPEDAPSPCGYTYAAPATRTDQKGAPTPRLTSSGPDCRRSKPLRILLNFKLKNWPSDLNDSSFEREFKRLF